MAGCSAKGAEGDEGQVSEDGELELGRKRGEEGAEDAGASLGHVRLNWCVLYGNRLRGAGRRLTCLGLGCHPRAAALRERSDE